ncbi:MULTISPECIES: MATE family efflux transporter [Alphaproteobacteria]|uniref:MATE family efflux transporter n=1 Tax=Alphaproteobacteria TaxID=28211 RepID=UPI0019D3641C|nr:MULTISPECIES: MATE family efflux transporter [Alphaproteobacteria]MBY6021356.1 MATE family efflux transporter [Nitratireductor sp. DP7N14-4]MBN7756570.1 MATE family efflux transporter [Nitratireductor aquimarinus]MBN7760176.1 MATE family efflux transporter [Nitratireductor aquibiodomus]MBN7776980.1 MATE family efflux transporter [Nitratireductor pacificus]MBN7780314.1 MATE family efflux transporter [Nitratireductor pacificus]
MTVFASGARAPVNPWIAEARATLSLAWPMVLTNLAQNAMTTTDVMMMGRLGPDALAAGTLGYNLYFAPLIFGLGLLLATSPMMATALGRKLHAVRDVRRTVRQGLWLAIAVSLPIWLLLWQSESILLWMGQDPELARIAGSYVRTLQWAALPFFGYIILRSFISALERPGWALGIMFVMVAFNVLANWALMFGNLGFPALGVPGSGIATTISSTLMFLGLALVVSVERNFRRYQLFGRFWRADWPRFFELIRLGLPIAGSMTFEVTIFNAAALLMGLISAPALAAHAIAIQIASISFMVPLGLSQTATVRVGRAFGAQNLDGITRAGWTAFVMCIAFMALMALLMVTIPELLIGAFLDLDLPENAEVIGLAITFLAFAGLFQIFDGAQAVAAGMLRGLHDTKVPMVYSLLGYWGLGMTSSVVLAFTLGMGGPGIWIGLVSGLAIVSVLLYVRWLRRDRLIPWLRPNAAT